MLQKLRKKHKKKRKKKKKVKGETDTEECVFPVCILKGSKVEKEVIARPGTRLLDPELNRDHLTFLLMRGGDTGYW